MQAPRPVYYGYDLRGLQLHARFDSASGPGIANQYDGFGRLVSTTADTDGIPRTLAYQHDANGSRTRIAHPDLAFFVTVRDGLGRSFWLESADNAACYYNSYRTDGLPGSQSRGNGASTWTSRDGIGRLNGLGHYSGQGGANDVLWLYQHNPASQIRSLTRDNDSYAWTRHYAVNRAYTANGLNQYTQAGSATLGYDLNGNLTATPDPNGQTITYTYDVENRLVAASTGAQLAYDPLGRLYQVTAANGTVTRFLYDGDALVAEYNAAGEMTRRYVHWDGADVPILSYTGAELTEPFYLHADHQGSIVAISGASGASQINRYDEYGIPGATNAGRFQYTGQAWLAELGLYYYKARLYSPTLGRFLQTDPVGYQDQFNLYAYVGNDPVNRADPSGKQSCRHPPCPDIALPAEGHRREAAAAIGPANRRGGEERGANTYVNLRTGESRLETGRAAGHPVGNSEHREFEHHLTWNPRIERPEMTSHVHNGSERAVMDLRRSEETRGNNFPSVDDQRGMNQTGAAVQIVGPDATMTLYRIDNVDHVRIDAGDRSSVPARNGQHIIVDPED